jgi:beta-galactosidase
MGGNALRTSHNPPAPELLDLADSMGFLVLDEAFDCWSQGKTSNDYHLLYSDWHEPDMRSFVRRDRNHPSVIAWSLGNEIPEQSTSLGGSEGQELRDIVRSEDPTRYSTSAMNSAPETAPLANVVDIVGLNYQGEYGAYGSGDSVVHQQSRHLHLPSSQRQQRSVQHQRWGRPKPHVGQRLRALQPGLGF